MCSSNNQSERSLLKSAERGREAADMRTAFRLEREREQSVYAVNGAIVVASSTRAQIRVNLSFTPLASLSVIK